MTWQNRIVGSGEEAPDQLLANPANWRTHPRAQREALRGSLSEVGWVQQVMVNRRTGFVVDGHARVEEALSSGAPSVPVLYVDLAPEEEALVLATLDPIGAMATRDDARLTELLADLHADDPGLAALLEQLVPPLPKAGLTDPDDAPPLGEQSNIHLGDLFLLGDHRLLCGDSTVGADVGRLMAGARADVMFTDPPYGVAYTGGTEERLVIAGDRLDEPGLVRLLEQALAAAPLRPGAPWYVCSPGGNRQLAFHLALRTAGFRLREVIVWVKDRFVLGHSDYHWQHEDVLAGLAPGEAPGPPEPEAEAVAYGWAPGAAHTWEAGRRESTVWQVERPAASREHPTMKPIELIRRALVNSSRRGAVVYEPFCGSGSTIIAAEQLGRRCYAMDIDPRYVAVAIERWENFTGQKAERCG